MTGRQLLVTGSTSGIGRAVAARCVADGSRVTVVGREPAATRDAAADLAATNGGEVSAVATDLHTEAGTDVLVQAVRQRTGHLHGLVLSHGGPQVPEIFADGDPAAFAQLAEVMLLTNARLLHGLLPLLRGGAEPASVVLVVSDAGRYPTTGEAMIGALAAANLMLVRTLAREWARENVRLNAVAVSLTLDTRTHERVLAASDFSRRLFEKAADGMPFGPVQARDVADTVLHLLGASASTVTDQVVAVSGGLST